jgi:hypothetical protein
MNYHVRRQGEELGVFALDELRRRHAAGELTGAEYVQAEGKSDWQPLDWVLKEGYRVTPPPLPISPARSKMSPALMWTVIVGGAIVCFLVLAGISVFISNFQKGFSSVINQSRVNRESHGEALAVASKPITWTTNTLTANDEQKRAREFRLRQWLAGYEQHGERNPKTDAEAEAYIRAYVAHYYGGPDETNKLSLADESARLANNPDCTDPLVLTVAADERLNYFDAVNLLERALAAYPNSKHSAYPRLYATIKLISHLEKKSDRTRELQAAALKLLPKCFSDGSFTPGDQQEMAEIFVNGWASTFFKDNQASVCATVRDAGSGFEWLALMLDGEREINEAWAARGNGYADTVSAAGWQGFNSHLSAAGTDLKAAWQLQPSYAMAPCRMINVALGNSDIDEMRLWFDRAVAAQIDYNGAWSAMRWGLRPRWYGNETSMLALGRVAIDTGRFDTDVPRKFMDCLADVESENSLTAGQHLYGRADIWPDLQRMYDGYVAAPSQEKYRDGWRSCYVVVAYLAGRHEVARTQLEALNWKPHPQNLTGWGTDLSLMALEVAARTGPVGQKISAAEAKRDAGNAAGALNDYSALKNAPNLDDRTREFVRHRLSLLAAEQNLQKGEWVRLQPSADDDPDWVVSFGKARVLPDGALEVESGPQGHLLYSRVRAGMNFEVRGQYELVHSANENFQGGVVMGLPNFDTYDNNNWYGFRLKRHKGEGDIVSLGQGWSRRQIAQHVALNDVTNSFDFIFQNHKVTATVNGVEVFHDASPPAAISVSDNSFLLGLGAFSDSSDTIIRYRGVEVRKF